MEPRALVSTFFDAAVAAADPFTPTRDALVARLEQRADDGRGWVVAVGKAAGRMARGARLAAADTGLELAGGLVVAHEHVPFDAPFESLIGDHPFPAARSRHAAIRLGALAQAVLPKDHVLLVISGGTSSLIACGADGVPEPALESAWRTLLGAGAAADVRVMNAIRRRFLRWGGGRLAAALQGAHVHQVLLSDVIGDDPGLIGSGPATPDPLTAREVLTLLHEHRLVDRFDKPLVAYLHDVIAGRRPETPKRDDSAFASMAPPTVIGRVRLHDGVARAARDAGVPITVHEHPLTGDAATAGRALAHVLTNTAAPGVHCWTGETTVELGERHGRGGRCQELALSAAISLAGLGESARRVTILAAGTDGRDGPTDAAGAIVDASTVSAITARNLDAATLLARHDAYTALNGAGALLRTGATGTNLADIVVAVVT
jgi:hydroxypyruvate reductase